MTPSREAAAGVALLAHRWRLMALPGIRGAPLGELVERLHRRAELAPISLIELAAIETADSFDVLCASAVAILSGPGSEASRSGVLDLLSVLEDDKKAALYFALPDGRRGLIEEHPGFEPCLQPWRDIVDAAWLDVEELLLLFGRDLRAIAAGEGGGEALALFPEPFRSRVAAALSAVQ